MKMLLKIHRGIGIDMKQKLIMDYMEKLMKKQPETLLQLIFYCFWVDFSEGLIIHCRVCLMSLM